MKKLILLVLLLAGVFASTLACQIEVKVDPASRKEQYKEGDELVVLVRVKKEHRNCPLPIDKTTYEREGVKILSATDWEETSPGVWERKMKLKVTRTGKGAPSFLVRRKCDRENSLGELVLNTL